VRPVIAPKPPSGLVPGPAPTFSIVTAAYQAAASIAECVESALAQTLPAHEIVVVDDGSTDGTADRLAPYRDRILYIRQENRGLPAALNAGVRAASADFVAILDADDAYEPERLEALSELARARPDLDIVTTDAYLEVNGTVVGRFYEATPFEPERQRLEIIDRCFVTWPAIRRAKLLDLGGYDEAMTFASDWECHMRLLYSGCRAGAVDEPLMRYRMGSNEAQSDKRVQTLRHRVYVLERAKRFALSDEERRQLEFYLGRRRRRVLLAESEQALRERRAGSRRTALAVATASGMPVATRVRAAAAAIAPRLAARRLAAIERRTGHSYAKRRLPDADDLAS
jgi:glycosyltransferase involved in cell wall biosynthesis